MLNRIWMACFTLAGLFGVLSLSHAEAPPAPSDLKVTSPYTSQNLTVWLILGPDQSGGKKYLTLAEAMEQKKLIVHETGDVNQLSVENVSDEVVFIPSGSIVKGGKQDRTLGTDMIITKADGKMPIDAFCVEHGRWAGRGGEATAYFGSSSGMIAGSKLKMAANSSTTRPSQSRVWDNVSQMQQSLQSNARTAVSAEAQVTGAASPSSFQLTLETEAVKKMSADRRKALEGILKEHKDAVGYVFAVNNKIAGGNVYASQALFQKLWPMQLDAAIVESVSETPTTQPAVKDSPALPTPEKVLSTWNRGSKPTKTRELNRRTTVNSFEGQESTLIETVDPAISTTPLSRSLLIKSEESKESETTQDRPRRSR